MSSPPYVKYIRSIDEATNKVSNSPTTLAPLPFPNRPGTSIAIEHRSGGVQMATKRSLSMSFNLQHPSMTAY